MHTKESLSIWDWQHGKGCAWEQGWSLSIGEGLWYEQEQEFLRGFSWLEKEPTK